MANGFKPLFELHCKLFSFSTSRLDQPVSITRGANFEAQDILNRSSPIFTYASSNPKTVNIIIPIYKISKEDGDIVPDMVKAFEAIQVPEESGTKPPPLLTVNLYGSSILKNFKCLCFNATSTLCTDGRLDDNGVPLSVEIACTFVGIELKAVNASEIYSGGDYDQTSRP